MAAHLFDRRSFWRRKTVIFVVIYIWSVLLLCAGYFAPRQPINDTSNKIKIWSQDKWSQLGLFPISNHTSGPHPTPSANGRLAYEQQDKDYDESIKNMSLPVLVKPLPPPPLPKEASEPVTAVNKPVAAGAKPVLVKPPPLPLEDAIEPVPAVNKPVAAGAKPNPPIPNKTQTAPPKPVFNGTKAIIAASIIADNVTWISTELPDWQLFRYINDDASAELTIPMQRGRESTAYLTYIIDHYDTLPDIMVFIHGQRYQWHNDDPMYDHVPPLRNLQLPYVQERGYANLRCSWDVGCPAQVHPDPDPEHIYAPNYPFPNAQYFYTLAWPIFFPNRTLPSVVGAPCCSQFAVTRERVLQRTRTEYFAYRDWLQAGDPAPQTAGRVFEYLWHIIMGMPEVDCPDAGTCYCEKYGLCGLDCQEDKCKKRYHKPMLDAALPSGWPEVGPGTAQWPKDRWWEVDDY